MFAFIHGSLDFFIVIMGFLEMSPAAAALEIFPVVVLRLLRLLRVFRLAKALPRLRSIVDALLSGVSSVGWILVLLSVFNYICACASMVFLRRNDPVHWGSVGRAMFTLLQIETLDAWDGLLLTSMLGCDEYTGGYERLDVDRHPAASCSEPSALGWFAAFIFFFLVISGAFILPTVLIGIISISFDEASRRASQVEEMQTKMERIKADAVAVLPDFFTQERFVALRAVFDSMDADGEMTLDVQEMAPFYQFAFDIVFHVDLTPAQTEDLFHLMDMDGDTELGFAEFVLFVTVIKKMEARCLETPGFKDEAFPPDKVRRLDRAGMSRRESWRETVKHLDEEAVDDAWVNILHYIEVSDTGATVEGRVQAMFSDFDTDGTGLLDVEELSEGLESIGVLTNSRQVRALTAAIDANGDGIGVAEFAKHVEIQRAKARAKDEDKAVEEARHVIHRVSDMARAKGMSLSAFLGVHPSVVHHKGEHQDAPAGDADDAAILEEAAFEEEHSHAKGGKIAAAAVVRDQDRPLEDVVSECAGRVAQRFVHEEARRLLQRSSFVVHGGDVHRGGAGGNDPAARFLDTLKAKGRTTATATGVEAAGISAEEAAATVAASGLADSAAACAWALHSAMAAELRRFSALADATAAKLNLNDRTDYSANDRTNYGADYGADYGSAPRGSASITSGMGAGGGDYDDRYTGSSAACVKGVSGKQPGTPVLILERLIDEVTAITGKRSRHHFGQHPHQQHDHYAAHDFRENQSLARGSSLDGTVRGGSSGGIGIGGGVSGGPHGNQGSPGSAGSGVHPGTASPLTTRRPPQPLPQPRAAASPTRPPATQHRSPARSPGRYGGLGGGRPSSGRDTGSRGVLAAAGGIKHQPLRGSGRGGSVDRSPLPRTVSSPSGIMEGAEYM